MFSIKGTFKDNKIQLSEPLNLKERTNVIITFLNSDGEKEVMEAEINHAGLSETDMTLGSEDVLDEDVSLDFEDDLDLDSDESFADDMLVDEDDPGLIDDDLDSDEAMEYDLSEDDELSLDDGLDDDIFELDADETQLDDSLGLSVSEDGNFDDEFSEKDYSKIRKHKRYKAKGKISLLEDDKELVYPLFDYSAGGLSFISDRSFEVKRSLTASIKDPIDQDSSVLDFEFEVVRVMKKDDKFKIGCKFFDEVDEEIWHSLMS